MADDPAREAAYWISRTPARLRKKLSAREWVIWQVPLSGEPQTLYRPCYLGGFFHEPQEVSLSFWDIGYLAFRTEESALLWVQHLDPVSITPNGKPPRQVRWAKERQSEDCGGAVVSGVVLGALLFSS